MTRKEELYDIIRQSQEELWKILEKESADANKALIGRYYKSNMEESEDYYCILRATKEGNLECWNFADYGDLKCINFEHTKRTSDKHRFDDKNDYEQISPNDFYTAWAKFIGDIQSQAQGHYWSLVNKIQRKEEK